MVEESGSEKSPKSTDRVVILSPLRRAETPLGKVSNKASDAMTRLAARDIKAIKDLRAVDFRPGSDDIGIQREEIEAEIRGHMEKGEQVAVIGSSANGQEALRKGKKLGVPAVSNQGRLAEGTTEHKPSLDHAARKHPPFAPAIRDFVENVAPQIMSDAHPEAYLTIGAPEDSVVPRDLKSLPGIPHVEIDKPGGMLGLVSKIPGVDHAVAIYKGFRHPALLKHIQGGD